MVRTIDGVCQRYGQRPSSIIGIKDELVAYEFDVSVAIKGSKMEQDEMESKTGDTKKRAIIDDKKVMSEQELKRLRSQFGSVANLQNMSTRK